MDNLNIDFSSLDYLPDEIVEAAHSTTRVSGLTHQFYRYPARFSPEFARAAIQHYTEPNDLVLDPFVGGGTTLVEAQNAGRDAVGFDISALATFVSQVKTTPLTDKELELVQNWFGSAIEQLRLDFALNEKSHSEQSTYLRNLNCSGTWRHRKIIQVYLSLLDQLPSERLSDFLRCVLLRTAQTQLDGRKELKPIKKFREALKANFETMVHDLRSLQVYLDHLPRIPQISLYQQSVADVSADTFNFSQAPRLVLTSPPYPGVHVLYHRWQVRGGRETPVPFWIANRLDGKGISHYTLGDRNEPGLVSYFAKIEKIFKSVVEIADRRTTFVQMVAFSQPEWQLPSYLEAMERAGLVEVNNDGKDDSNNRLWRNVPNRKWYAQARPNQSSSKEVVLFHRLA